MNEATHEEENADTIEASVDAAVVRGGIALPVVQSGQKNGATDSGGAINFRRNDDGYERNEYGLYE